jgi:putative ABC transport system permease protein
LERSIVNTSALDIGTVGLLLGYILLIVPMAFILYYRVKLLKPLTVSVVRLTLQLLLVGLYLQVVFRLNAWWLNVLWLILMLVAADISLVNSSRLKLRPFLFPVFVSLVIGTGAPLIYMLGVIVRLPNLMDARYFIPIAGMITGNSLRADIVGLSSFYSSLHSQEKVFLSALAQGASLNEAVRPFLQKAYTASLAPTIATMATIGIVALPGMMTGIILGGTDPFVAIKYQIAIMMAIFSGSALAVILGILLTLRSSFDRYGILKPEIFK